MDWHRVLSPFLFRADRDHTVMVIAELWFLVGVRWVVAFLETGRMHQRAFAIVCGLLSILLAWLGHGGGVAAIGPWLEAAGASRFFYRLFYMNFCATASVGIEGILLLYLWRIDHLLRVALVRSNQRADERGVAHRGTVTAILLATVFAIYLFYHAQALAFLRTTELDIYPILLFYLIRLSGFSWIAVEVGIAAVVWRIYWLLKRVIG